MKSRFFCAIVVCSFIAACGGGGGGSPPAAVITTPVASTTPTGTGSGATVAPIVPAAATATTTANTTNTVPATVVVTTPPTTTSTVDNSNSGGAANACPNASNSFSYYPAGEVCNFYKTLSFMVAFSGTINLTSYYLDSDENEKYRYGIHNGIDFQTSDVAGKKCQTTQNCIEHEVLAPIAGKVVAKDRTYGAVILEFTKPVNGQNVTYDYAVLHMKAGSSDHLNIGDWVPMGKKLGIQWNTSSVNGRTDGTDISAHVHLEFSIANTNRVLTQGSDSNGLSPLGFLPWINASIDSVDSKLPNMVVSQVVVTGPTTVGKTAVVRATGSSFPPTAFLGMWTRDTVQDQSVASCNAAQTTRGTVNGLDYIEQTCILNRAGTFDIFVKPKSGKEPLFSELITVQNPDSPRCYGIWTTQSYSTNAIESRSQSCPIGESGSIKEQHICQANGAWSTSTTSNSCAPILLSPRTVTATSAPGEINVSWSASAGATDYDIWREISPDQPVFYETTKSTSFKDLSLVIGNQYCYYLSARRVFEGGYTSTGHPAYSCVVAR